MADEHQPGNLAMLREDELQVGPMALGQSTPMMEVGQPMELEIELLPGNQVPRPQLTASQTDLQLAQRLLATVVATHGALVPKHLHTNNQRQTTTGIPTNSRLTAGAQIHMMHRLLELTSQHLHLQL